MAAQHSELIDSNSNELCELWHDAYFHGKRVADGTVAWLPKFWANHQLPIDIETGVLRTSSDVLFHAGAVTSIWYWYYDGRNVALGAHVLALGDAYAGFCRRVLKDPSGESSTEGADLAAAVYRFEATYRLPFSRGRLEVDADVSMVVKKPEDDAIDELANLLLDFAHLVPR